MSDSYVYGTALTIIIFATIAGVFSRKFDDNLVQRFGLAVACLGAALRLLDLIEAIDANNNARYLLTYGYTIFSVGTVWKFWRKP